MNETKKVRQNRPNKDTTNNQYIQKKRKHK